MILHLGLFVFIGCCARLGQAVGWMREVKKEYCVYMELPPCGGEKDHQVRPHMKAEWIAGYSGWDLSADVYVIGFIGGNSERGYY